MKIIKFIVIALLFTSCVTNKQREKILKDCPVSSFKKDTVWQVRTEKSDTVYKTITGPTAYLPNPCKALCDSLGNLKPFKQTSTKNGIKQSLESVGNILVQKCDVDSLLQVNKTLTIENNRLSSEKVEVHENCKLEHITDWDNFFIITGKGLWLIIIILALGWAVKKFILKR